MIAADLKLAKLLADSKPPYGAWRTLWGFILGLAEHPLPQFIDNSVMEGRSGSTKSELYVGLRFFGLIDAEKRPTPTLHWLVSSPTLDRMRDLVVRHYQPVIELGLETATPRQLDEALLALGSGNGTIPKARAFFLHAAQDVGVELGRTLVSSKAPSAGRRRRAVRPRRESSGRLPRTTEIADTPAVLPLPLLIQGLVARLPPEGEGWDPAEALQWLEIVRPALAFAYGFEYPASARLQGLAP
jgi:hypothetical protein